MQLTIDEQLKNLGFLFYDERLELIKVRIVSLRHENILLFCLFIFRKTDESWYPADFRLSLINSLCGAVLVGLSQGNFKLVVLLKSTDAWKWNVNSAIVKK